MPSSKMPKNDHDILITLVEQVRQINQKLDEMNVNFAERLNRVETSKLSATDFTTYMRRNDVEVEEVKKSVTDKVHELALSTENKFAEMDKKFTVFETKADGREARIRMLENWRSVIVAIAGIAGGIFGVFGRQIVQFFLNK